ncbi:MAG: peptide-methionine (S)-S-oxide reductase MsrA [Spirochaetota bacterium]
MVKRILTVLMLLTIALLPLAGAGDRETGVGQNRTEKSTTADDYDQYPSAVFAGGCFWGVEAMFEDQPGVITAVSGYTGGEVENPSYEEVLTGETGHAEAVKVYYDPQKTDFRTLAKYFFEIHDPTQIDRQGPDVGTQYRSAVYYANESERKDTEQLIAILEEAGYEVATEVSPRSTFYTAESYHQDYYAVHQSAPYCHFYQKRFP